MRRFIAARLAQSAIVVVIVTVIAFFLLRLAPGEPFSYEDATMSPAVRAHWRAAFGHDKPVVIQLGRYLGNVARGNFGYSILQRRPAVDAIADAVPRTLMLAAAGVGLALLLGVGLGALAASRAQRRTDQIISAACVFIYSIPEFWLALIIQLGLGFAIPLFPVSGIADPLVADYGSTAEIIVDRLRHVALPALTMTLLFAAIIARFQRAALLDVLPSDFLRTARAKGVSERAVVARHGLRNALTPTITLVGFLLPTILGGIFFIEYVFDWHGLGWLTVTSVQALDYDVVTASVIVSGVFVTLGSLAADVVTAIADPRVRDA